MAQTTTTPPSVSVTDRRSPYVIEDWRARTFRVNREVFRSEEIFAREQRQIWDRQWLYLGHETEVPKAGDFKQRTLAGRPLIFARDSRNKVRAYLNSCPHRGTGAVPRDRGEREDVPVLLPRVDVREHRRAGGHPGSGRVSARARFRRGDGAALGPALRELPRVRLRLVRSERPEPQRPPRGRARLPRHDGRPFRARPAGHPRHAHVRDPRELEARGRERHGRLPLLADAHDVHRVPEDDRLRDQRRRRPGHHAGERTQRARVLRSRGARRHAVGATLR
jgi:hypothetical protein